MRILGIDSSSPECSIALLENEKILSQASGGRNSSYSDHLLKMVNGVLCEARLALSDVDGFAVTTGPGSFTGLRVGVSLVKGFILATEKPFEGVDTLEALAALPSPTEFQICPVLDARKGEVYYAIFSRRKDRLIRISENSAAAPEKLCEEITEPTIFLGSGLAAYRRLFAESLGQLFMEARENKDRSLAASAAVLASGRFEVKNSYDLSSLKINYVRKPEAELNYIKKTTILKGG